MSSFFSDPEVGGNGSTTTDDRDPATGLDAGGWKTRFIPALAQVVAIGSWVKAKAETLNSLGAVVADDAVAARLSAQAAEDAAVIADQSRDGATSQKNQAVDAALASMDYRNQSRTARDEARSIAEGGLVGAGANQVPLNSMLWSTAYANPAALPVSTATAAAIAAATATGSKAVNAAYTVIASDRNQLLRLSGTFTLGLTGAATLGAGFTFQICNVGIGVITIDPAGAEMIAGRTTISVYAGETFSIIGDGSTFRCVGRDRVVPLGAVTISSAVASLSISTGIADSEFSEIQIDFLQVFGNSSKQGVVAQVVDSNGTTLTTGYGTTSHSVMTTDSSGNLNIATTRETPYAILAPFMSGSHWNDMPYSGSATLKWKSTGQRGVIAATSASTVGISIPGVGLHNAITMLPAATVTALVLKAQAGTLTAGTIVHRGIRG